MLNVTMLSAMGPTDALEVLSEHWQGFSGSLIFICKTKQYSPSPPRAYKALKHKARLARIKYSPAALHSMVKLWPHRQKLG
jgi:hypothetical protein